MSAELENAKNQNTDFKVFPPARILESRALK